MNMKRCFILLLVLTSISLHAFAQLDKSIPLQSGDLLFEDLDCGPLCDAIEGVTQSYGGNHFSHIGLVYVKNDSSFIIEAIGGKVQVTPVAKFAARTTHKIFIGRLKEKYQSLNAQAVQFALGQLAVPYDDVFLYDNGKYYCSELIYDAYKSANNGKPFFRLEPMTFMQPGTKTYYPVWVDYYKDLRVAIPQGKPGINPGGISRSDKINILNP